MATVPHSPLYTPLSGELNFPQYLPPPARGAVTKEWIDMMRAMNPPAQAPATGGFFNALRNRIIPGERGAVQFGQTTGQPAPATRAGRLLATRSTPRPVYQPVNYGPRLTMDQLRGTTPRPALGAGPSLTPAPTNAGPNWAPGTPVSSPTIPYEAPVAPPTVQTPQAALSTTEQLALGPGSPPNYGNLRPGQNLTGGPASALSDAVAGPQPLGRVAQMKANLGSDLTAMMGKSKFGGKALAGIKAHPGLARAGLGIGLIAGAKPAGSTIEDLTGSREAGGAVEGAARWGGSALGVPIVGAAAAPIAAAVGAGYGAVAPGLKDLYAVENYQDMAHKFNKIINSKQLSNTKLGDMYVNEANDIHANDKLSMEEKSIELKLLDQRMAQARKLAKQGVIDPNDKSSWVGGKAPGGGKKTKTALAIQMADAMNKYGQQYIQHADLGAQYMRDIGSSLQGVDPALAGLANGFAGQRSAEARTMADQFNASLMVQPQIDAMQNQLAQYRQYMQRIEAANSASGGSSSTISGALEKAAGA